MNVTVREQYVEIDGLSMRYLSVGEGPPLVLLHGAGDNALDWKWVMPYLAATHRVYAPDLPGSPDSARPTADYSPTFFERFVAAFVDALEIGRATFVGNAFGGLIALRLALSDPARVRALVLVDSAGLGREINPAFASVNVPGLSEAAIPLWRTPLGAYQRSRGRTALLFAHPASVPHEWLAEQCRLALSPGYLEAHLTALRAQVDPGGQREVLVDQLSLLKMTPLVVWGPATGCSQSPRQERRPLASRKVHLPSYQTAVTCPTWSAPIASSPPSNGSWADGCIADGRPSDETRDLYRDLPLSVSLHRRVRRPRGTEGPLHSVERPPRAGYGADYSLLAAGPVLLLEMCVVYRWQASARLIVDKNGEERSATVPSRSSREDKNEGKMDRAKGRAKEAGGALTGDKGKKSEGQADQRKGKAKEKKGAAKDLLS